MVKAIKFLVEFGGILWNFVESSGLKISVGQEMGRKLAGNGQGWQEMGRKWAGNV